MTVIFLMGPTATGKTDLSFSIAKALPIEIINIDSTNVYRGMDIGTAKPSPEEQKAIPHHLIDIREPWDTYSAGECCIDARKLIEGIKSRGKIPLLVGGTMMYFQTLLRGYDGGPTTSPEARESILKEAETHGWQTLWKRLRDINPEAANRIHENDKQRIGRALEREFMKEKQAEEDVIPPLPNDHSVIQIALKAFDRNRLREQIATRLDKMLEKGFLDEVKKLLQHPSISPELPSMRSVGYAQACSYLSGDMTYDTMKEAIRIATSQLAKRQHTWLNQFPDAFLVDCFDPNKEALTLNHIHLALAR